MGGLSLAAGSFIGQIVSRITGVAYGAITDPLALLESFFSGVNNGLGTLADQVLTGVAAMFGQTVEGLTAWAVGLITNSGLYNAVKAIWPQLISVIPIANINVPQEKVNLLNVGAFATSSSLEASNGWSLDSASNRTGNTGGAAKLNCAAATGVRYLYSNQNIKVSPGDRIGASAFIKSASFNGNSSSIAIAVIPFVGTAQQGTITLASRGASTNWVEFGSEIPAPSGGVNLIWEVPKSVSAQVTSVQMVLIVNSSATTGSVYFDDLVLYKTGLLKQGSTENLLTAFGGVHDGLKGLSQGTTSLDEATQANMFTAATAAQGLANTANNNASAASGAATAASNAASAASNTAAAASNAASAASNAATAASNAAGAASNAASVADGKAVSVATGLRTTVGGEPGTTGVPASSGTYVTNLLTKLYGTSVSTPQTFITNNAINGLPTTRLSGTIGQGQITDGAVSTAKLASNVVSDITSTVRASTVGSGTVLIRSNTTSFPNASQGRWKFIPGFFDQVSISSSDMTAFYGTTNWDTGFGIFQITGYDGRVIVTNPGWYMVEVGFAVNPNWNSGGFNIAPTLYRDGVQIKTGTDVTRTATRTGRYAQASWIVYLTANQSVQPGYDAALDSSTAGASFFKSNTGTNGDTYFSVSLLNRSLA
jgi:hypothetical protein